MDAIDRNPANEIRVLENLVAHHHRRTDDPDDAAAAIAACLEEIEYWRNWRPKKGRGR
jgi:hypothetical protein